MKLPGFKSILLLVLISFASGELSALTDSESARKIGTQAVQELLQRPDYMQYSSDHYNGLHYAEAAAGYGALKFANQINHKDLLKSLAKRYQQVPGTEKLMAADHVDANVWGILPIQEYLISKDKAALQFGLALANAQWATPLDNGLTHQARFWIDDMWMIGSLQIQAYRATKDPIYLDRAASEIVAYLKKLQQPNGLFFHGPEAHFYWGRGNGWVAAALAELLSELPASHVDYRFIEERYKIMMTSLLKYQASSGMWRQLVDYPDSWEESSATAMFGFAIAIGVQRKILDKNIYAPVYQKAWKAIAARVNDKGQLADICVGTGQSKDVNYYLTRPSVTGDFHGQAPLLWFAQKIIEMEAASRLKLK